MRSTYETDLKQDDDGTWFRWIGINEKGTKQQFRLGKIKSVAIRRLCLIQRLFDSQVDLARDQQCLTVPKDNTSNQLNQAICRDYIEKIPVDALSGAVIENALEWLDEQKQAPTTKAQKSDVKPSMWLPDYLKAAKKLAKGDTPILPRAALRVSQDSTIVESSIAYAENLAMLNEDGINFAPNLEVISEARASITGRQQNNRILNARLFGTSPEIEETGQTVGQALEAFMNYLKTDYTEPGGSLTPWGKTQITQVKSWMSYLSGAMEDSNRHFLDMDLANLTTAKAQQMVQVISCRPLTIASQKRQRMALKTAQSIQKKIKEFWGWLDLSDEWKWTVPRGFQNIDYSIKSLTDEEKHLRNLAQNTWRITDENIQILFRLGTPSERTLILLGLNCAFGAGEVGNLRIPYVLLDKQEIQGIRFKTGNQTRHHLWPETCNALKWELDARTTYPNSDRSGDIFFLSEITGQPLWHRTKNGNYVDGISKRWSDLMKRVLKHHPDFPLYSFGKFRKTAAIRIIEMANAEIASMILAHSSISDDKLLTAYTSIPWQKLYEAQKAYGETVRPLLTLDVDPFEKAPKDYIGGKALQILELHDTGHKASEIAETLGLSRATVYRHLGRTVEKNDDSSDT